MIDLAPPTLARSQIARDRRRLARYPRLLPHKIERMSASPLAFLRGAAPLYYALLAENRGLLPALPGRGWIAGDLHLENFGAFRPGGFDGEHVAYGPNDFDDAVVGPWACDALRLATSVLLALRPMLPGRRRLRAVGALLEAHAEAVAGRPPPALPRLVQELLEHVATRKRVLLLDHFTDVVHGGRRLRRGEHFHDLPAKLAAAARAAFAAAAAALPDEARPRREALEVVDVAFRVAGTGSLGMLRVGVLVAGKGGRDGGWMFDMKEQGVPSPALLLGKPRQPPAERVLAALRACLEHAPRLAGTTRLGGRSMLVRRLAPQEDRVDVSEAGPDDAEAFVIYLGGAMGAAHRRGAVGPAVPWTSAQRERLVDAAITLAGVHEAAYLAYLKALA